MLHRTLTFVSKHFHSMNLQDPIILYIPRLGDQFLRNKDTEEKLDIQGRWIEWSWFLFGRLLPNDPKNKIRWYVTIGNQWKIRILFRYKIENMLITKIYYLKHWPKMLAANFQNCLVNMNFFCLVSDEKSYIRSWGIIERIFKWIHNRWTWNRLQVKCNTILFLLKMKIHWSYNLN